MKLTENFSKDLPTYFRTGIYKKEQDRRRNQRKPLELSVYCQKVGDRDGRLFSGSTVNVSPGGLLVNMPGPSLRDGELVSVDMAVSRGNGLFGEAGRFSSYARVVRIGDSVRTMAGGKEVALEFCESPRVRF